MIQDGFVFLPFSVDTWEMTATHFALGSCQRTCHEVPIVIIRMVDGVESNVDNKAFQV